MQYDQEWNAGELGCGELALELKQKLRAAPGQLWRVVALDPGAPADIPAWCSMTGNALIAHDPAAHAFFIRAKR
jgi:tRNA 2-thiouridine synthesizing protein A